MKKIFILFTIFTSIAFGDSDKTIVKYDSNSWQNGHFLERTEWAKKVTQSENCKLSKEGKLYQIHSIGLNVMKEDPAIWLNGKYLEFINSRCNLKETYTIRGTTKEDFDKLVNKHTPSEDEILKRVEVYQEQEKQESKLNILIGILFSILIVGWFLKYDKSKDIPTSGKKKSPFFWRFFWWCAFWDTTNSDKK